MIARIWRGLTPRQNQETYYAYLQNTGLKDYASVPGNRGVWVLRRVRGETAEFLLISLWDSYPAIRAFAGEDYKKAVYYPEDAKYLLDRPPGVDHYEVLGGLQP